MYHIPFTLVYQRDNQCYFRKILFVLFILVLADRLVGANSLQVTLVGYSSLLVFFFSFIFFSKKFRNDLMRVQWPSAMKHSYR